MSLQQQATKSIKWSVASQVSRQVLQFGTMFLFARLLTPADFGLMGMATIVTGFLLVFKDLGTSAAVIHQDRPTDLLLSSLFWANSIFGACITVLLAFIAPVMALFFKESRVTSMLMVLGLTFFVSSLTIVHQALLQKTMAFDALAKIEVGGVLVGAMVGVFTALNGGGVWSLVAQVVSQTIISTLGLWRLSNWRPKLQFSKHELSEIAKFSLNLTGFNVFNYFARNVDNILIGRYLGAASLGYYNLAYKVMLYPLIIISETIGRVLFPLLSQVKGDRGRFVAIYLEVVSAIAMVSFPLMVGLFVLVEPFVVAVLGPQWLPIIPPLMVLAPVGMLQSIVTTVGALYQSQGRTDLMFRWGVFSSLVGVASFIIGLKWGVLGVAASYAVANLVLVYPNFAIPFRLIDLRFKSLGGVLWRPFVCSVLMGISLVCLREALPQDWPAHAQLTALVPIGAVGYFLASWLLNRKQVQRFYRQLMVRVA